MPTNILMPALSPTMTEGTLAKWLVKEGDEVNAGDVIAEIETDKATMEVEAVDEGRLGKILVEPGTENVAVNKPIAVLLEDGEDENDLSEFVKSGGSEEKEHKKESMAPAQEGGKTPPAPASASTQPARQTAVRQGGGEDGGRLFVSPLARRIAEQNGIDLSTLQGSGPHGRIVKADVEQAKSVGGRPAPQAQAAAPSATPVPAQEGADMPYTKIPNNNIRKIVAQRLQESKQTVPHFYLTIECRIDTLLQTRKEINDQAGGAYKLSVNDFIIKACANALQAYPAANTSWTEDAILQYHHADISVAVATENGLITPIVKQAETKGLKQISEEVKDLAGRAREGKLVPEEFQGGTFTVSNLGMFGIQEFGAIINPPQACILAVGAGEKKPYVDDQGEIKVGTFMKCTLSVDHRAVDGAVGAEYLQILKRYIENPVSMLL